MLHLMQLLLVWFGTALALLAVLVLWGLVIFVIIDETIGLIRGDVDESDELE